MSQRSKTAVRVKMIILLSFGNSNLAQRQPSITEHQTAQFTSEWEAAVNSRIWTILLRRAAEFCKPTRGSWKNISRKTVVPNDDTVQNNTGILFHADMTNIIVLRT